MLTDAAGASVAAAFQRAFGRDPSGVWAAPGRVNLIGEHTDYTDGFVLPLALAQRVLAAAAPFALGGSTVRSVQHPGEHATFDAATVEPGQVSGWAAYGAGVFWALRTSGHDIVELDILVDGDVPLGAGLSSSAALECAVAVALAELAGRAELTEVPTSGGLTESGGAFGSAGAAGSAGTAGAVLDRTSLALQARRAENLFVGAPTGVMDQMASLHGRAGHLVFIDTRSLAVEHVPFDLAAHGLALLVIDTGATHALVDGQYAQRRANCDEAARALGVPALRDVAIERLDDQLRRLADDESRRRVRHVVTENARVLDVVAALRSGSDPRVIGPALTASHASLRHDFEVTVPQLDLAVERSLEAGAHGARMTGGGFGGCVIALVDEAETGRTVRAVEQAFADAGFDAPASFVATPSPGAGRLS